MYGEQRKISYLRIKVFINKPDGKRPRGNNSAQRWIDRFNKDFWTTRIVDANDWEFCRDSVEMENNLYFM